MRELHLKTSFSFSAVGWDVLASRLSLLEEPSPLHCASRFRPSLRTAHDASGVLPQHFFCFCLLSCTRACISSRAAMILAGVRGGKATRRCDNGRALRNSAARLQNAWQLFASVVMEVVNERQMLENLKGK